MPTYRVSIPITGHVSVEVEAEDESEAETKAWGVDYGDPAIGEVYWEARRRIVSGNVFHGMLNEIEIEEI